MRDRPSPAYRAALTGILAAEAVALSFLESLLPAMPFLPPGAKLGLANIVVMFSAMSFGLPTTLAVIAVRSLFTLAARGLSAFLIGLSGGLLSGLTMYFLSRLILRADSDGAEEEKRARFGYVGVSAVSAVAHDLGQLAAASVFSGVPLLSYLPLLIAFGIFFGTVTGLALSIVTPVLRRQTAVFFKLDKNNKQKRKQSKVKDQ